MSHFITLCSECGKVISQCRCMSCDKIKNYEVCEDCSNLISKKYIGKNRISEYGIETIFTGNTYQCHSLKFEDYNFVKEDKDRFEKISKKYWLVEINKGKFVIPRKEFI